MVRLSILGSGPLIVGSDIDRSHDFKHGFDFPRAYCLDIKYGLQSQQADVKYPWELSVYSAYPSWSGLFVDG